MNYTINYGGTGQVGASQQRTIVLTPPNPGNCHSNTNAVNQTGVNQHTNFPMMIPIGASNTPVFYTYQNSDGVVNTPVPSHVHNDSTNSASTGIGQVMISPVSPVANNLNLHGHSVSPTTIPTVNIASEKKIVASRSLNELFNIQSVNAVPNAGSIVHSNAVQSNVPITQTAPGNTDIASILSSLQAAGFQIVDSGSCGNTSNSQIGLLIMNTQVQPSERSVDRNAVTSFMTSLQGAGLPVIENNSEKPLSISLPSVPAKQDSVVSPLTVDKMYGIQSGTKPSVASSYINQSGDIQRYD